MKSNIHYPAVASLFPVLLKHKGKDANDATVSSLIPARCGVKLKKQNKNGFSVATER